MERLTEWENGSVTYNEKREIECGEYCDSCSQGAGNCETIKNMIKKLADYEDLEEQGLLVRLPCKVGDTVYVVLSVYCKSKYAEAHVRDYTYFTSCGFCVVVTSTKFDKQSIPFSEFGKTVFLTREEVEKNLEELKNEI